MHKIVKKHKNKTLDRLATLVAIAMPILTIPQLYKVVFLKETAGVSLLSWSAYAVISVVFVIFGVVHKEKLLMVAYIPMSMIELGIVIGLILNSA